VDLDRNGYQAKREHALGYWASIRLFNQIKRGCGLRLYYFRQLLPLSNEKQGDEADKSQHHASAAQTSLTLPVRDEPANKSRQRNEQRHRVRDYDRATA
jgi:hypothetical protein